MKELEEFKGKKLKVIRKINGKLYFHHGYLKNATSDHILFDDQKTGITYLSREQIISIEILKGDYQ